MREKRDQKFEVRGSKFRKPRTSDIEPFPISPVPRVSLDYPARCSPVVLDVRTIEVRACHNSFSQSASVSMVISRQRRVRNERGVTYLMLMFAIVLIGIATTAAAKQWKVIVQRELEADLLAKGIEIQNALAFYSATIKAGRVMPGEVYPQTLADLTRLPKPFLRKVYLDPMGHGEWEFLRAPTGGIMGVRVRASRSHSGSTTFPLLFGISRDAPRIMIGSSNTRIPHQVRQCHKGLRPVLWRHYRRDHRSLLAEALQLPSQFRSSRP